MLAIGSRWIQDAAEHTRPACFICKKTLESLEIAHNYKDYSQAIES